MLGVAYESPTVATGYGMYIAQVCTCMHVCVCVCLCACVYVYVVNRCWI